MASRCHGDCAHCDKNNADDRKIMTSFGRELTIEDPCSEESYRIEQENRIKKLNPLEVLEKARELSKRRHQPKPIKLTLGDLSVATREKRKRDQKRAEKYLFNQEMGLTVGQLYERIDPHQSTWLEPIQPAISESQKLAIAMMDKHAEKMRRNRQLRQLMNRPEASVAERAEILRSF